MTHFAGSTRARHRVHAGAAAAMLFLATLATLASLAAVVVAPAALAAQAAPYTPPDSSFIRRAVKLLQRNPLIDSHNDLPSQLLDHWGGDLRKVDLRQPQAILHTDIPRLRAGHVGAQFWSAFVDGDSVITHAALRQALRQIDMVHRMVDAYPQDLEFARSADDIVRIQRAGKVASLIGVEGGHGIENSLAALRMFYDLGVRYMTLTHFKSNDWADAATDSARHHGLTPFGKDVVREMNRVGMFVDLAHVSDETMRDAIATSVAPVIFSHSSARAISNHVRNVPDDILHLMPQNGGVVMVNFYPLYTVPEAPAYRRMQDSAFAAIDRGTADTAARHAQRQTWTTAHPVPRGNVGVIADHIEYVVRTIGIDHVGLGSDFDGIEVTPVGLDGVDKYPVLIAELLRRGHSEADVAKIAGGNLLRAMREMEAVSARLRRTVPAPPDH